MLFQRKKKGGRIVQWSHAIGPTTIMPSSSNSTSFASSTYLRSEHGLHSIHGCSSFFLSISLTQETLSLPLLYSYHHLEQVEKILVALLALLPTTQLLARRRRLVRLHAHACESIHNVVVTHLARRRSCRSSTPAASVSK